MRIAIRIVALVPEQAVAGRTNQEQGEDENLKGQIQLSNLQLVKAIMNRIKRIVTKYDRNYA